MTVLEHGLLGEHLTLHVTLSFPDLGSRKVKPVYTVHQTGLAVNQTTCGRFILSQRVYKEEGEFYAMESVIREEHANLCLCWGGTGSGRRKGHACPMRRSVRQVTTLETIESGKDGGGLLMDICMDGHGAQWNVEFSLPV